MAFSSPIDDRWFEDYVPGETHDCGTFSVTEAEIIEFATRFDPQPFHLDREVAAKSVFGGLVTSGMHTTALMMRQFVDHYISSVASVGGLGTDHMRLLKPVRPGVVMSARATVLEARRSKSKPDRGFLRTLGELTDEDGDTAMRIELLHLMATRRPE